ncbi:hypothetical protein, conserved [Plasmodium gonderi]|uniref:Sec16 Sec23-binding domain-containing protein n=1 Tax=Plasmodium gonderi TaxID=77519 RepID=A0A1Y1JIE9_PLAGO|nr:hypothetical protein, conserved [Plasmodium gonderi]GAW80967.1 hypothetical protein, conserved [Plasmodium gonderi]
MNEHMFSYENIFMNKELNIDEEIKQKSKNENIEPTDGPDVAPVDEGSGEIPCEGSDCIPEGDPMCDLVENDLNSEHVQASSSIEQGIIENIIENVKGFSNSVVGGTPNATDCKVDSSTMFEETEYKGNKDFPQVQINKKMASESKKKKKKKNDISSLFTDSSMEIMGLIRENPINAKNEMGKPFCETVDQSEEAKEEVKTDAETREEAESDAEAKEEVKADAEAKEEVKADAEAKEEVKADADKGARTPFGDDQCNDKAEQNYNGTIRKDSVEEIISECDIYKKDVKSVKKNEENNAIHSLDHYKNVERMNHNFGHMDIGSYQVSSDMTMEVIHVNRCNNYVNCKEKGENNQYYEEDNIKVVLDNEGLAVPPKVSQSTTRISFCFGRNGNFFYTRGRKVKYAPLINIIKGCIRTRSTTQISNDSPVPSSSNVNNSKRNNKRNNCIESRDKWLEEHIHAIKNFPGPFSRRCDKVDEKIKIFLNGHIKIIREMYANNIHEYAQKCSLYNYLLNVINNPQFLDFNLQDVRTDKERAKAVSECKSRNVVSYFVESSHNQRGSSVPSSGSSTIVHPSCISYSDVAIHSIENNSRWMPKGKDKLQKLSYDDGEEEEGAPKERGKMDKFEITAGAAAAEARAEAGMKLEKREFPEVLYNHYEEQQAGRGIRWFNGKPFAEKEKEMRIMDTTLCESKKSYVKQLYEGKTKKILVNNHKYEFLDFVDEEFISKFSNIENNEKITKEDQYMEYYHLCIYNSEEASKVCNEMNLFKYFFLILKKYNKEKYYRMVNQYISHIDNIMNHDIELNDGMKNIYKIYNSSVYNDIFKETFVFFISLLNRKSMIFKKNILTNYWYSFYVLVYHNFLFQFEENEIDYMEYKDDIHMFFLFLIKLLYKNGRKTESQFLFIQLCANPCVFQMQSQEDFSNLEANPIDVEKKQECSYNTGGGGAIVNPQHEYNSFPIIQSNQGLHMASQNGSTYSASHRSHMNNPISQVSQVGQISQGSQISQVNQVSQISQVNQISRKDVSKSQDLQSAGTHFDFFTFQACEVYEYLMRQKDETFFYESLITQKIIYAYTLLELGVLEQARKYIEILYYYVDVIKSQKKKNNDLVHLYETLLSHAKYVFPSLHLQNKNQEISSTENNDTSSNDFFYNGKSIYNYKIISSYQGFQHADAVNQNRQSVQVGNTNKYCGINVENITTELLTHNNTQMDENKNVIYGRGTTPYVPFYKGYNEINNMNSLFEDQNRGGAFSINDMNSTHETEIMDRISNPISYNKDGNNNNVSDKNIFNNDTITCMHPDIHIESKTENKISQGIENDPNFNPSEPIYSGATNLEVIRCHDHHPSNNSINVSFQTNVQNLRSNENSYFPSYPTEYVGTQGSANVRSEVRAIPLQQCNNESAQMGYFYSQYEDATTAEPGVATSKLDVTNAEPVAGVRTTTENDRRNYYTTEPLQQTQILQNNEYIMKSTEVIDHGQSNWICENSGSFKQNEIINYHMNSDNFTYYYNESIGTIPPVHGQIHQGGSNGPEAYPTSVPFHRSLQQNAYPTNSQNYNIVGNVPYSNDPAKSPERSGKNGPLQGVRNETENKKNGQEVQQQNEENNNMDLINLGKTFISGFFSNIKEKITKTEQVEEEEENIFYYDYEKKRWREKGVTSDEENERERQKKQHEMEIKNIAPPPLAQNTSSVNKKTPLDITDVRSRYVDYFK